VEHFLQSWGYTAIFVLALVEAICIPFPSEITFGFAARWRPRATSAWPG